MEKNHEDHDYASVNSNNNKKTIWYNYIYNLSDIIIKGKITNSLVVCWMRLYVM